MRGEPHSAHAWWQWWWWWCQAAADLQRGRLATEWRDEEWYEFCFEQLGHSLEPSQAPGIAEDWWCVSTFHVLRRAGGVGDFVAGRRNRYEMQTRRMLLLLSLVRCF